MSKDIYVIVEQRGGEIQKVSIELIGKARELVSDGGNQVVAVLMGYGIGDKAKLLGEYGAHRVIVIDHPILENYITEPYVKAIEYIIRKHRSGDVERAGTQLRVVDYGRSLRTLRREKVLFCRCSSPLVLL